MEGIDFNETFSLVAHLKSILMALACTLHFKIYQMDVKSSFLNDLNKEVFVAPPKGFEDPTHPKYVYKMKKALCGLK